MVMDFKTYLVSKGLTEEQATAIVAGMPAEKIYLASEEKLDERYAKLKQQKEQAEEQLASYQTELDTLKESAKGNDDLTKQLADMQAKFDEAKTESETKLSQQEKDFAIKLALKEANPLDESIILGLLDKDTIKVTENGLQGFTEQLAGLKESKAFLFQQAAPEEKAPNITLGGTPKGAGGQQPDAFQAAVQKFS
jgi:chromosome segregation ATPase